MSAEAFGFFFADDLQELYAANFGKIVFFWTFGGIWEHFHDLERIFTKNSDFPGPSPGLPVVRHVVLVLVKP